MEGVEGTPIRALVLAAPRCTDMPPVAPAPGVAAPARGLGVAATVGRGVMPEKSLWCRSGFSPPTRGVAMFCGSTRTPSVRWELAVLYTG